LLLGNGDGTFKPETLLAVGAGAGPFAPVAVVAGNLAGDRATDVAVTNRAAASIAVLRRDGPGSLTPVQTQPTGHRPNALVAGDFNGDGRLDLAASDAGTNGSSNLVWILLGGAAGFAAPAAVTIGGNPLALAAGDFNGDGALDLATANGDNGGGSF